MKANPLNNLLLAQAMFCGMMILMRNLYSGSPPGGFVQLASLENWGTQTFLFLGWNLLLAWAPYWIAGFIGGARNLPLRAILLLLWLLFLPNAPYLITDLIHLRPRPPIPLWYDALMLFSAAWTGLLLGYCSLLRVESILCRLWGQSYARAFAIVALALCGFGVYLGRFLRWNSWDALTQPLALLKSIFDVLSHLSTLFLAMGISVLFTAFLGLGYYTIHTLSKSNLP